ncbi:PAS domain S-box protein [Roseomonas nepalensis]|uniref:histidine kinase n=1 Tax=Muricoccus nepalensis TaxID=1854500 RepID=A0A502G5M6_9PROT|nr:PAS domain S-box protein [Roseomonas nepalensis]
MPGRAVNETSAIQALPPPAAARRGRSWPRAGLLLSLGAAVLAPPLLAALSAWGAWDATSRGAEAEVARTADAAAEYARRLLEGQFLRLQRANDVLAGLSDAEIRAQEADWHVALDRVVSGSATPEGDVFYITVYDRDARALVASNILPVAAGRSMMEREFNRALRPNDAPPFHISPVYVGRETGRPYFALSARRERTGNGLPPGTYDGVVNASFYHEQVNRSLQALAASPENVVSLVRTDGALLARSSGLGNRPEAEARIGPGAMLETMRRGEERSVSREVSSIDGVERVVAYRRVGGPWPVYVSAARARSLVSAAWRQEVLPQAILALASSALLLALARAVLGRQRELEGSNEALESRVADRTRALAESSRLMQLAQQAARVASWSWEPGTGRASWSPEMYDLLGLDAEREAGLASAETFFAALHPDDRPRLHDAIEGALRDGTMTLEMRVFRRGPEGQEERWLLCRARLYPASEEAPATLVGIHVDITDRRRIGERFEAAVGAIDGFVYERELNTGRATRTAGVLALLGKDLPEAAAAWLDRIHPEDRAIFDARVTAAIADPAQDRYSAEYRVRRADGSWAWVWDRGRVFRDPATGRAVRALGGLLDVTARRLAEERQALLMREVDHRGKNALAVVKAALRLTPGNDPVYRVAIEGRVDALARAQSLLAETNWAGTGLRAVLESTLAPFLDPGTAPRALLEGPEVVIPGAAVQALTMALHELATNATKYGALSARTGVLRVSWRREGGGLHLRWAETGGPAVGTPARKGFGSRVVDGTLGHQLGGTVRWDWAAEGLIVEIRLPSVRPAADAAPAPAS